MIQNVSSATPLEKVDYHLRDDGLADIRIRRSIRTVTHDATDNQPEYVEYTAVESYQILPLMEQEAIEQADVLFEGRRHQFQAGARQGERIGTGKPGQRAIAGRPDGGRGRGYDGFHRFRHRQERCRRFRRQQEQGVKTMVRFNHAAAVRMYTRLVKAGRKTLDEVPEEYRAEVRQNLLDPWF